MLSQLSFDELPAELKAADDAYGWRHVVVVLGSIYALLFAAYYCAARLNMPWMALVILPLLGAQIYKITILMHDSCHFTLLPAAR